MKRIVSLFLVSLLLSSTLSILISKPVQALETGQFFVYSRYDPPGIDDVVGVGGYVEHFGLPEWGDEVQHLYFLSGSIGYKMRVYVTDGDGDGIIDPRQHPDHYLPEFRKPLEPRHFDIVSQSDLGASHDSRSLHTEEFYVDSSGVYLGAWPNGINKWDHDWNYVANIAGPPPERTESMAYDPAGKAWYAGGRFRTIYQLRDTNNDGSYLDESWQAIIYYPSYGGGHHDGLEYVGGYLWITDMTSDVIGKWHYNTTTQTWDELGRFTYYDEAPVEGMGFGPNDHFWCGGGWGSSAYIYELGNEITRGFPIAEAGKDIESYPPVIPVIFDASGSRHTDINKQIVLYEWDFESDGTWDYSGTETQVQHAYPAYYNTDGSINWDLTTRSYTAALRVTDNNSPPLYDVDKCTVRITPPPWKPVADPDGPYMGSTGVAIQLNGSNSYTLESRTYPPDHPWYRTIGKYEWDFDNDGQFDDATGEAPVHTWTAAGLYVVGLKVTDSQLTGPGGTIGQNDVGIEYTTVIIAGESDLAVSIDPTFASLYLPGGMIDLSSIVSGGQPPYNYQWYLDNIPVPGAVFSMWTFKPTAKANYSVHLNVTDSTGSVVKSNAATVNVTVALTASISPTYASLLIGQSVTFTSNVSGVFPPFYYQWWVNGNPVDAWEETWTFTPDSLGTYIVSLEAYDSGYFDVMSNEAQVSVVAQPSAPTASISPISASVDIGQPVSFTTTASGGITPYAYQWYLDDNVVSGATASSWTFTPSSAGAYAVYVIITDNLGSTAKSNTASVYVSPSLTVSISPLSAAIDIGQSQSFTSIVSGGTAPYAYQWYLNGAPVSGATNPAWTFTPPATGSYTVFLIVIDSLGQQATEKSALLTVNALPAVSILPVSATIHVGDVINFNSAVSGGTPPYSYQWYLSSNPVSGATSASWTFTPTTTGNYTIHLNVTDNLGNTAKSNDAVVTVAAQLTVSISPMSASVLVGQSVAFTSTVSGGYTPYTYQWYLNGNPVSGATSASWTFTPTASGIYYVHLKVTDAKANTAQSDTARITFPPPLPVGGYSVQIQVPTKTEPVLPYIALIATLTAIFTTLKSRIKRRKH